MVGIYCWVVKFADYFGDSFLEGKILGGDEFIKIRITPSITSKVVIGLMLELSF